MYGSYWSLGYKTVTNDISFENGVNPMKKKPKVMKKLPCNSFKRFKFVFISPMKWKKCPVFILRVIFSCEAPLLRSHIWFPEFSVSCCMHCVLCCCRQIHVVVKQWKQNICHWRRQSTPNNWWFQFHSSDDEEPNAIETEIERAKTVEKNVHPVQRSTRFDDDDNDYYSNFTFHFVEIYDYAFFTVYSGFTMCVLCAVWAAAIGIHVGTFISNKTH